jgi:hypothetical protein
MQPRLGVYSTYLHTHTFGSLKSRVRASLHAGGVGGGVRHASRGDGLPPAAGTGLTPLGRPEESSHTAGASSDATELEHER